MASSYPSNDRVRISVVIPTFQRRDLVVRVVRSLMQQEYEEGFEVIVICDGSTDGSASALRALDPAFRLTVVEQKNQGASVARNAGARVAAGDLLLFIDDDMICDERLLAEHDASHRAGAEVVLGHLDLHPDSPPSILRQGIRDWADERIERLSKPDAALTLHDLLTGQLSLGRNLFTEIGGFDTAFTLDGSFGNEDVDFGYRLLSAGRRIVFNPAAVTWQVYTVSPSELLERYRHAGRADVVFARKHPERSGELFALNQYDGWRDRYVWYPLAAFSPLARGISGLLRRLALKATDSGSESGFTRRLFGSAWRMAYWRGVWEAGGIPASRSLRVLAYHAIREVPARSVLAPYCVPPHAFSRQLDALLEAGYRFIDGSEFCRFIHGDALLARRSVLLTFDDGYEELARVVLPILEERRIPAIVFAVSRCLGGTNAWDDHHGAEVLRLADEDDIRALARSGVEIGAHSRTHPSLPALGRDELEHEVAGSAEDLEAVGIPRPRFFSYPYGESSDLVRRATTAAGFVAAFGTRPGLVRQSQDRFDLPRIEIMRPEADRRFRWQVASAGRISL